eukprot:CAMPEP_0194362552 /NCGR_PEP_ID=MMETSP0174-20130528/10314_1 /TAXON_ID=216777 /ORGANISM="Proboscia alata, Strain PI-D3" /LENGTH=867 /DNA_ID=CAMNT_0039135487 /DNA_START=169 /DNA_END=2772 /DNA_ORIENTATION=+
MEVSRDTSEILAGKLHKRRDFFTTQWRSRHFVLDKSAGILHYYLEDPKTITDNEIEPRGSINLLGCFVNAGDNSSENGTCFFPFSIMASSSQDILVGGDDLMNINVAACGEEDRRTWIIEIIKASKRKNMKFDEESLMSDITLGSRKVRYQRIKKEKGFETNEKEIDEKKDYPNIVDVPNEFVSGGSDQSCVKNLPLDMRNELFAKRNKNVPVELAIQNENVTNRCLDLYLNQEWTFVREENGVKIMKRPDENDPDIVILRSDSMIDNHHRQILNLLMDTSRTYQYKHAIVVYEDVKCYNPQSNITFNSTKTIWPCMPREVLCFQQVRVYPEHNNLIIVTQFSSPLIDHLRCVTPKHLREDISIGCVIIIPLEGNKSKVIRWGAITIPPKYKNLPIIPVLERNFAKVLVGLKESFKKYELNPSLHLTAEGSHGVSITEENILANVIKWTPSVLESDAMKNSESFEKERDTNHDNKTPDTIVSDEDESECGSNVAFFPAMKINIQRMICFVFYLFCVLTRQTIPGFSSFRDDITLLLLVVMYQILLGFPTSVMHLKNIIVNLESVIDNCDSSYIFTLAFRLLAIKHGILSVTSHECISVTIVIYFFLRSIALDLIEPVPCVEHTHEVTAKGNKCDIGFVTCRFDVDAEPISTFISCGKDKNISALHVVIKAVAESIQLFPALNGRNINVPWLGVSGFYPNENVEISILKQQTKSIEKRAVNLSLVETLGVREIASILSSESLSAMSSCTTDYCNTQSKPLKIFHWFVLGLSEKRRMLASCVILNTPDVTRNGIGMDVTQDCLYGGSTCTVTVGRVHLVEDGKSTKPVFPVSIGINCPSLVDQSTCFRFAQKIHLSLQNPALTKSYFMG